MCNDFRFFTLRCVQNDREEGAAFDCVRNDREGVLRCVQNDRMGMAVFGMTEWEGCVRNDRGGTFRSGWQSKLLRCVRDDILSEIL